MTSTVQKINSKIHHFFTLLLIYHILIVNDRILLFRYEVISPRKIRKKPKLWDLSYAKSNV